MQQENQRPISQTILSKAAILWEYLTLWVIISEQSGNLTFILFCKFAVYYICSVSFFSKIATLQAPLPLFPYWIFHRQSGRLRSPAAVTLMSGCRHELWGLYFNQKKKKGISKPWHSFRVNLPVWKGLFYAPPINMYIEASCYYFSFFKANIFRRRMNCFMTKVLLPIFDSVTLPPRC